MTLSIEEDVLQRARQKAEVMGTSVNQLIRNYLYQLSGKIVPNDAAAEFERLSHLAQGDSQGWKFDREELHRQR